MNFFAGILRFSPRTVVRFLGVLAVAIQILVVQTHVHPSAAHTVYIDSGSAVSNIPLGSPADEDSTNCLLCQELVHAGSYLTPAAVVLPAPPVLGREAVIARDLISVSPSSHSWHGRAPPSV